MRSGKSSLATAASSMQSPIEWIQSLSPWPEEFGLERMRALLAELGDPQLAFPSVHVVGTNGKSTTTRLTAALLRGEGLRVAAYTSPHVSGWHERLDIDAAGFERAITRVRPAAERLGATQFEALTAAALSEFAAAEVDVAVVEAGLGGRLDATNVLRAPVVVLTNVGLDHTEQLGETREEIAAEKLAVVGQGAAVVLCEPEWQALARSSGAGTIVLTGRSNLALAVAAAETYLGRPVDRVGRRRRHVAGSARAAGRGSARDLGRRPQPRRRRLAAPARPGPPLRRRRLDPPRQGRGRHAGGALGARRYAGRNRLEQHPRASRGRTCKAWQPMVHENGAGAEPGRRARRGSRDRRAARRGPRHGVAVPAGRPRRARRRRTIQHGTRLSVFVFAAIVIAAFAGLAFAVGYVVGKLLL